jgi:hypothetical protein
MSIQLIRELDNNKGTLMSAVGGIMADRSRKMDFNAPYGALAFETDIDSDGLHVPHVVLEGNAGVPTTRYEFTQHALAQFMERLRIDIRTARYILQRSPREATELVNALLAKKGEETMLLRTFDGNGSNPVARSFLSPSYKILDHEDVLETMLPVLAESDGQWESVRAGSSDQRMLFSFKSRTITADASPLKLGDMTALGVQLTNSEVGSGSASLSQLLWTLACLNGMSTSNSTRKTHLGKARTDSDVSLLTSDTKDKIKLATLAELSDSLAAYSSVESFDSQVALFTAAHNNEVPLESLTSIRTTPWHFAPVLPLQRAETRRTLFRSSRHLARRLRRRDTLAARSLRRQLRTLLPPLLILQTGESMTPSSGNVVGPRFCRCPAGLGAHLWSRQPLP